MKDCGYKSQCQTAQGKRMWSILVKCPQFNYNHTEVHLQAETHKLLNHRLDVHDSFRQDYFSAPMTSAFVLSSKTSFMGNFCSTAVESWETFWFPECLSHSIDLQLCLTRRETVWKPSGQVKKMSPRIIVMLDWNYTYVASGSGHQYQRNVLQT